MPSWTKSKKVSDSIAPNPGEVTDGLLLVDKPSGPGSAEMVSRARRATGIRRIGHTGTLDRFASGLLVLVVGRATVLADSLLRYNKTYEATFRAGRFTDTHDPSGEVLEQVDANRCLDFLGGSSDTMESWIHNFAGSHMQVPPDYSALKQQGKRVSDRVRRGESVRLEPRPVRIYESSLLDFQEDADGFVIHCRFTVSSGTYIRSIVRDFSRAMEFPFFLGALRRTSVGPFTLENSWIPEFEDGQPIHEPEILSLPRAFPDWYQTRLDVNRAIQLEQGRKIPVPLPDTDGENFLILRPDGTTLAIAQREGSAYCLKKVFVRS
ncbi:MAG TPA: tRNA pseudouridine(55) synthase TruB [Leptospiraceae bacterium]|nr:tRNA pseudouridine(55) synthase TruB [Spirochaetaceae bacterium]HBS06735.1 tRNA pseudouridine(55) synthase TruB [Leptospiraceae bacterium]|tara:strand:+ start:157566 stop:158531 length:966 start_codon:yes stop_codon:yes gene_type:complete